MQHAGDAVWRIWGHVAYLNKVGQSMLAMDLQAAISIISEHVHVAPPPPEVLAQLSSALENLQPTGDGVGYASERQQQTSSRGRGNSFSDPELVSAATTLVDAMVDSEQFEWADMVTSISEQLKEKAFVTPKQCRALRNVATGRRYGEEETFANFWDFFADENPAAAERVGIEADKADR